MHLPLPPSNNSFMRHFAINGIPRTCLSKEAKQYMGSVGRALWLWARSVKYKPIDYWRFLDMWIILPRTNADPSNYHKTLFDTLQEAGIVIDDKYLLPRVMGISFDAQNPGVIVEI